MLLVILLALVSLTDLVSAQESAESSRERREAVRKEQAEAAAALEPLEASDAELEAALEALDSYVALQTAQRDGAVQAAEAAQRELDLAMTHQGEVQAEIAVLEQRATDRAIAAYISSGSAPPDDLLNSGSLDEAARREVLLEAVDADDADVADELRAARLQADRAEIEVRSRSAEVLEQREKQEERLAELTEASAQQRQLQAALQTRIDELGEHIHDLEEEEDALDELIAAAIRASSPDAVVASVPPASSGLTWPVNGRVSSEFGPRWGRTHKGLDISAPSGTRLNAAGSGVVIHAGWKGGYGNAVLIDHGNGLVTLYGHMSRIDVSTGASVSRDQQIGAIGCTGSCTGPHVHFEVHDNGGARPPRPYLP